MHLPWAGNTRRRNIIGLILIAIAALSIIAGLKLPGVFIAMLLVPASLLMLYSRPDASEQQALRTSIVLSAEDIQDTIAEYTEFLTSPSAEALADRTLTRPALVDVECGHPDVERFHFQLSTAKRYLSRLEARLAKPDLEIHQLEQLLSITDARAMDLKESWLAARRAALAMGTSYPRNPLPGSNQDPQGFQPSDDGSGESRGGNKGTDEDNSR